MFIEHITPRQIREIQTTISLQNFSKYARHVTFVLFLETPSLLHLSLLADWSVRIVFGCFPDISPKKSQIST